MSQSKSREDAELGFSDVQSQFSGRGNPVEEIDLVTRSREEKTSRLREARLAKEEEDRLMATTKPAVKTRKKA